MKPAVAPNAAALYLILLMQPALATATPAGERDHRLCSAWDVHITTQIEDFGSIACVDPLYLFNAWARQNQARELCNAGRFTDAFRIFETIDFPLRANTRCAPKTRRQR